jgi:4'-phosphopantetheinyl transferase
MREILSRYTGTDPHELVLETGPHGKPYLRGHEHIHFNLTHSDNAAALAITLGGPVGLDCESIRGVNDAQQLYRRICSPHELLLLRRSGFDWEVFYRIWTRKEAVVKAAGIGLKLRVPAFTVLQRLCETCAIVELPDHGAWQVFDIEAPAGYVAACCARPDSSAGRHQR